MTKRLIGWLVLMPLTLLLVLFTLANRHVVTVKFDPLMSEPPLINTVEVPLFIVIYLVLLVGIFLGGIATWFTQSGQRQQKRHWRQKAERMQEERDEAKKSQENLSEQKALFEAS